jgi:hypothetical protein
MNTNECKEPKNSNRNNKGQFGKGNQGKPKGAVNKTTAEEKQRIEWVLSLLDERLEENLSLLRPKEQIELWLNLQEFVRPKLQRMNLDLGPADDKISKITFEVIRGSAPLTIESGEEL